VIETNERPLNKNEAVEDGVVGGTVVGTTGTVTATQIGVDNKCCNNDVDKFYC
jgi:hypothetical protein